MNHCSICLENHTDTNTTTTNCNHKFGKECINQWLNHNNTCPLCRTNITNIPIIHIKKITLSPYDENGNLRNRRQNYFDLYREGRLEYENLLNNAHMV